MPTYLVTEWFGAFRVEDGRVAAQSLFPRDPKGLAGKLKALQDGEVLPEERELIAAAGPVVVTEDRLLQIPGARLAQNGSPPAPRAQDYNYGLDLLHAASLQLGRMNVREASAGRDKHVIMAVETIDDLLEASNLLIERLREWYGLHAPEIVDRAQRPEELAGLVSAHTTREAIGAARPEYLVEESMGAPLGNDEQESIRSFARATSHLYAAKGDLEKYLDNAMPVVAPNLTALLGATLAARFIRTAGGLERLARMPAGTIQTLGAEKALFRHIKEGKKPPKHGLLFQHLSLHRAPRHQRGGLARALAAKTAIAARADAFTKADIREQLVSQWEQREQEVRRVHAKPRFGRERFTAPGGRQSYGERPSGRGGPPHRGPPSRGPPQRGPPSRGPPSRGPPAARGAPPGWQGPPGRGPPREGGRPPRDFKPRYDRGGPPGDGRGGPPGGPRGDRPGPGGPGGGKSGGGGGRPPFGKKGKGRSDR